MASARTYPAQIYSARTHTAQARPLRNTLTPRTARLPRLNCLVPVIGLTVALGLTGCGGEQSTGSHSAAPTDTSAAAHANGSALSLDKGWIKTAKKGGMTAAFGTLRNDSDSQVRITGATSPAAGMVQLHETKNDASGGSSMQQKKGGFTVAAHGSIEFKPGGDHIMPMDLKRAIKPGDTVDLTLQTSAGDVSVSLPAKDFSGAKEEYGMGAASTAATHGNSNGHQHGHGDHNGDSHE